MVRIRVKEDDGRKSWVNFLGDLIGRVTQYETPAAFRSKPKPSAVKKDLILTYPQTDLVEKVSYG